MQKFTTCRESFADIQGLNDASVAGFSRRSFNSFAMTAKASSIEHAIAGIGRERQKEFAAFGVSEGLANKINPFRYRSRIVNRFTGGHVFGPIFSGIASSPERTLVIKHLSSCLFIDPHLYLVAPVSERPKLTSPAFEVGEGFDIFVGFAVNSFDFGFEGGEAITPTAQSMKQEARKNSAK